MADGYTGNITVNAQNVKLTQQTPATQLSNVSIVTASGGNSNLWIENLNIANTESKNIIKFQGADNYLTVKGTNTLDKKTLHSAIYIGGGLKIIGDGSLTMQGLSSGAVIGGNYINSSSNLIPLGDLIIGDNVTITATGQGAAIGNGGGMSRMGDILIGGNAKVTATTSTTSAAIGSGSGGVVGNISIGDNAIVTATSGSAAAIGAGQQSSVGNISIGGNATVIAKSQNAGAGIGTAPHRSRAGNILIGGNANVTATSFYGAGIGCGSFNNYYYGENPSVGDITISSSATVNAQSRVGDDIGGANHYPGSIVGTISNGLTTFDITLDLGIVAQVEPQAKTETSTITVDTTSTKEIAGNPLRIQSGTTTDDFINVFIEDMRTKTLGAGKLFDTSGNLINASDLNRYNALSNDTTKQAEWLATLKAAEDKTLDDVSLTTRTNAIVAIRVIDGAIDYALHQATNLGAMDNRLGYTADNIVTVNENTQTAESTIRDADIAKTMTNYTKYNLLTRIAQEMLAQANQNANAVLGLLK